MVGTIPSPAGGGTKGAAAAGATTSIADPSPEITQHKMTQYTNKPINQLFNHNQYIDQYINQ